MHSVWSVPTRILHPPQPLTPTRLTMRSVEEERKLRQQKSRPWPRRSASFQPSYAASSAWCAGVRMDVYE